MSVRQFGHEIRGRTLRIVFPLVVSALLLWSCDSSTAGPPTASSVSINPLTATIEPGGMIQLTATVVGSGRAERGGDLE